MAAVAAVFRSGDAGTEVLFIERATKAGDPWSGQMAFPGGRVEDVDSHSAATAERETFEEIGLDLDSVERLGSFSPIEGGPRGSRQKLIVHPHAYWFDGERPELVLNHEVAATVWVPTAHLADEENHVDYEWERFPDQAWPGVSVEGGRIVWGLTLRMLEDLFRRLGSPLPVIR
jgi:8-oxo-dGTP pyrophosphatase MutT (NUDIX family)